MRPPGYSAHPGAQAILREVTQTRADRGIEGDVASLAVGRSGLNVTPTLAFSAGEAAFAGLGASQLIKGSLQSLGTKISPNRYRAFRHSIVVIRGFLALILGW